MTQSFLSTHLHKIFLLLLGLFFIGGLFVLQNAPTYTDGPKNYREGKANLDFVLSGELDETITNRQMHGAFFFMVAEISKRFFHDLLNLYGPISARALPLLILACLFFWYFFYFIKKHFSISVAFISILSLMTFPYFFHHLFFNLKDIPTAIFMSFAILFAYSFRKTSQIHYYYSFIFCLALACSIKLYGFLTLLILFLWILLTSSRESFLKLKKIIRFKYLFHYLLGGILFFTLFIFLYAPWAPFTSNYLESFNQWLKLFDYPKQITQSSPLIGFLQYFYRAPVPFLLLSIVGLFLTSIRFFRCHLSSLLILWALVPISVSSLKSSFYYDGMRHFIIFIIPASLLAALAIKSICTPFIHFKKIHALGLTVFSAVLIAFNITGIAATCPYSSVYFNSIVGGLKGAQAKGIYCAHDYWFTSSKEIARWLDQNAKPNSAVYPGSRGPIEIYMLRELLSRTDVQLMKQSKGFHLNPTQYLQDIRPNSYLILAKFHQEWDKFFEALTKAEQEGQFRRVHELKKQEGLIYAILYKPSSS